MKRFLITGLIVAVAFLLGSHFRVQFTGHADAASSSSKWTVACGSSICVAVKINGRTFWGQKKQGRLPNNGFQWYDLGQIHDSKTYESVVCEGILDEPAKFQNKMVEECRRFL